ncbi:MAG: hypothetical protein H6R00_229 [Proteobacteria bacterium]|nr:hypothetical protein [Pseudomonadota bacterium]
MTVVSTVVRASAAWTGVETEIPTGIQVQERSQLIVSLVPDEGERQALTLGLHYAVTLSSAGVATIAPLAAFPATPGTVSMVRQTPMTQVYDPTATDTYDAAGHAAALDRSAMRVAELSQKVDDIEESSIVIAGNAASVPEGAVYVSNGEGGAVAGPTAAEIETARATAVSASGTATVAAGAATGAATAAGTAAALADQLANAAPNTPVGTGFSARHWAAVAQTLSDAFDLDAYSTTEQIAAMLESFVPAVRKLKVGPGLSLDGAAGSDAEPAETDLSADRLIKLVLASAATVVAGTDEELPVHSAGVHSAIVAALGALNLGGAVPKAIRDFGASGNYVPTAGTKFIFGILVGGSGGGNSVWGTGGGAGGVGFFFAAVSDTQTYPVAVGGGGGVVANKNSTGGTGGTTSIVIDGVTYYTSGGGGAKEGGGNGGGPSGTCLFGQAGAAGGWYLAGGVYGYGTGATNGVGGRAMFMEFGT